AVITAVVLKEQGAPSGQDGKLLNEQQIAELNSQLVLAHKQTSEAKARLDRINAIILDNPQMGTVADTLTKQTVAAVTLNSTVASQLRTRYSELVNREASWSRKYGANHSAVVNLRNEIREIEGLSEELKRLRESYLSNYEIAKQAEQELEKRLAEAVSRSRPIN